MSNRPQGDRKLAFENGARLLSDLGLENNLNEYYISANSNIPPLNMITLPTYLTAGVCEQLLADFSKQCIPDNIFCRIILKKFRQLFAERHLQSFVPAYKKASTKRIGERDDVNSWVSKFLLYTRIKHTCAFFA